MFLAGLILFFLVHSLLETYKNLGFLYSDIWNIYIYVWIIAYHKLTELHFFS